MPLSIYPPNEIPDSIDIEEVVVSSEPFALGTEGALIIKDGNDEDRYTTTAPLTITQLENRLVALETAPPSGGLPTGTNANEYLYFDGSNWVVGSEVINIGRGAGENTLGSTYIENNIFIGKNSGKANVGTNFYQNTVCIGRDVATNNQTLTRDSVCIGRAINNIRPYSVAIGSYMEKCDEGAVAIGRFSTNSSLNDRKVIGINSIAMGRSQYDIPRRTIYLDANNTVGQTGSPDAGSINMIAEFSQMKLESVNINLDTQPTNRTYRIGSSNGTDYTPQEVLNNKYEILSSSTINADADTTYTASQLLNGLIVRDGLTSNRDDTLATPAQIVSQISTDGQTPQVGLTFKCRIFNVSNQAIGTINGNGNNLIFPTDLNKWGVKKEEARILIFRLTNVNAGTESIDVYTHQVNMEE